MWLAVGCYVLGAILLRRVREPPRRAAAADGLAASPE
jgi:hypothetical protein